MCLYFIVFLQCGCIAIFCLDTPLSEAKYPELLCHARKCFNTASGVHAVHKTFPTQIQLESQIQIQATNSHTSEIQATSSHRNTNYFVTEENALITASEERAVHKIGLRKKIVMHPHCKNTIEYRYIEIKCNCSKNTMQIQCKSITNTMPASGVCAVQCANNWSSTL